MSTPLFPSGIQCLSDSKWSGVSGSVSKIVGIDYRSTPGIFKAQQKLAKHSPSVGANQVTELCKVAVNVSDGSKIWFSSESGKIWREVGGAFTLVFDGNIPDIYEEMFSILTIGTTLRISDTHAGNTGKKSAQSVEFSEDTDVTKISLRLRKVASPTGTMTVSIQADSSGDPSGTALISATRDVVELTDIFREEEFILPSTYTLEKDTLYWIVFEVDPLPPLSPDNELVDVSGSISSVYTGGKWIKQRIDDDVWEDYQGDQIVGLFRLLTSEEKGENKTLDAEEHGTTETIGDFLPYVFSDPDEQADNVEEVFTEYIYWSTENLLHRIKVEDIGSDWTNNIEFGFGIFENGGDFHPMAKQGLELFIGDAQVVAMVDDTGEFVKETELNIPSNETIRALTPFDIDILIGTKGQGLGRVLRWDGVSESWSAEDEVFEKEGVTAFIKDDNYVYAVAGEIGRMYFYNGEKLEPFKRIPGNWSPTSRATVHHNSVAFHLGVPVFGLSNVAGNPQLQGVYGFGSYGKDYAKTLSLDFPVPTNEFENLQVGAILADGADLYVAWKDDEDVGVAKLDWEQKYDGAYLETVMLLGLKDRSDLSNMGKVFADYVLLPDDTDILLAFKQRYEDNFTSLATINDTQRLQVRSEEVIDEIVNLQLKLTLQTNNNDSPEVENLALE